MATEYPDHEAALAAYAEAIEVTWEQAQDALLNEDRLESALARPRNAALYEEADLPRQAASLFWGLISNHPFRDGNKRTAVVLLYAFLRANDHDLALTDDELFDLAVGVAKDHWSADRVEEQIRGAFVAYQRPALSLAKEVATDEHGIHVTFEDGRVLTYPLTERLQRATPEQRAAGYVDDSGTALHWEEIDEDLGVNTVLGVSEDELYDFAGFTTGMPEK